MILEKAVNIQPSSSLGGSAKTFERQRNGGSGGSFRVFGVIVRVGAGNWLRISL
jgi:hypothetical protein